MLTRIAMALAWVWCAATPAAAETPSAARQILSEEIRFHRFDKLILGPTEACPVWLTTQIQSELPGCRRLQVVYRGVPLGAILVEHSAPVDSLAIYATGHESESQVAEGLSQASVSLVYPDAAALIGHLFDRRANVLVTFMPGLGLRPGAADQELRRMHDMVAQHFVFALLDFPSDSGAAYFVAHIEGFLDRFGSTYRRVSMFGRSGGGWTTTIAAAIDSRIQCSVSFFGSLPMRLRMPLPSEPADALSDLGDFEQFGLFLFKRLDYLDLYALAASQGHRHTQVFNERDNCCFSGAEKGALVEGMFIRKYGALRGFSTVILPVRSSGDHMNLDAVAIEAAIQACPIGVASD
jgi:hypothetical protein